MGRKRVERSPKIIENIAKKCFDTVGIKITDEKSALYTRLFISGLSHYFFFNPDDIIKMGFIKFEKSPDKDELFKITIQKSLEVGIINAETLWKYYTGELLQQAQFKQIIQNFMTDLIEYSQTEEMNITKLTSDIENKRRKK